jgi:ribonuclease E
MDRQMIINAIHSEECRIAIVENNNLVELEIESSSGKSLKGNIYKGRVSRVEASLQAAFVDIGTEKNAFLQINDIHPAYFKERNQNKGRFSFRNKSIKDLIEPGQQLIVQVTKDEHELKGATLTTYLSLPGRYIVLMPGAEKGGISRKISDNQTRKRIKNLASELELPCGVSVIIRTAGLDRSLSELTRDLTFQIKLWEKVLETSQSVKYPTMLYEESDLATRVVRDYFTPDIREIIVDDKKTFASVKEFVGKVMPRYRSRVRLHEDITPIFSSFKIEEQVNIAFSREVELKSGGAIIIDSLEALVAVDVNSGKATTEENIEETAFKTNLEAAKEVAKQLRLRDLGGLIVVDFIDMQNPQHKFEVEKVLRESVADDKARIEIGKISKFGLLEMSRQRLRASLSSKIQLKCGHCKGTGKVKNPELVAIEALRKVQASIVSGDLSSVKVKLAPTPLLFLLNKKRKELFELEEKFNINIILGTDSRLRSDEYEVEIETKKLADARMNRVFADELKSTNSNQSEYSRNIRNDSQKDGSINSTPSSSGERRFMKRRRPNRNRSNNYNKPTAS